MGEGEGGASDSGAAEAASWPDEGGSERSARRRDDLESREQPIRPEQTIPATTDAQPSHPPLTVDVAVKRHHARPFRTAEGGVMQLVGQGRGDPGLGVTLGGPAMLRRVLFMSCSAVLKPHL